jgi:hypothetical protein
MMNMTGQGNGFAAISKLTNRPAKAYASLDVAV